MVDQKQVIVPDSPEVRRLAALGSLNADLTEAALALGLVSEYTEADNDHDRALYRQLLALAVVVYGRAQTKSGARKALWSYVTVPPNLESTHDQVMKFRNRTIAHSESENESTYVMADLASDGGPITVERALVITAASPSPRTFVHRFQALVAELQVLLRTKIEVARAAVIALIDTQQSGDLWREGRQPQLVPRLISDWDPDTRRPPYPTSHEIPVYLLEDPQP
ncbi:hypothetical protein EV141_1451 [Microcella putealis]|uniref:Uncharacterized protein n=1 Tax=Microcella putealis TaxID=337005 RepID=A0A4Q7LU22_9MICO|nr:hypothetical protein [Microcella putealis]RZS57732.1 hypothetical protein EV141_1451 [Microcella putealis]TQM24799.1 hypothetical protein BJ957_1060 [Microcella putealis]